MMHCTPRRLAGRVSVSKNVIVWATIGRPQILHRKICSPQGENIHDFPLENPKIEDFRRAIKDRPYI